MFFVFFSQFFVIFIPIYAEFCPKSGTFLRLICLNWYEIYADVRVMGIKAMGALGSTKISKALNALITMLDDDVPEVRLAAAEQLGVLSDKNGQVVIDEYFAKPPPERNKNEIERQDVFAALAIGRIGTKSLKAKLPILLKSESKQVRLAAAKSALLLAK